MRCRGADGGLTVVRRQRCPADGGAAQRTETHVGEVDHECEAEGELRQRGPCLTTRGRSRAVRPG